MGTIDERTKHFFLEGATEPVALEFSIHPPKSLNNVIRVLSENGLQVTSDCYQKGKIYVSEHGIITPPLRPQDVRPIYEILEIALEEAQCTIESTPHIVDLQSVTPCGDLPNEIMLEQKAIQAKYKDDLKEGELSFEDHMINEAKASKSLILFRYPSSRIPPEILQDFSERDLVFSGSTISDPHRTATQLIRRNVRMASFDFRNALRYSHTGDYDEKSMCTHQLWTKGNQRYGFFHVYKTSPDQCYYGAVGIEFKQSPAYRGADCGETMVNRFKNPCVGEYLVLKERQYGETNYYLFPIPQNDERWQDFKKLSLCANRGLTREFASQHNYLFSIKDNPTTYIPLDKQAFDESGVKPEFYERRLENIKAELAAIRDEAEKNIRYVDKVKQNAEELQQEKISFEEKKKKLKELEKLSLKKKEENTRLAEQANAYNPKGMLAPLKDEIQDTISTCYRLQPLNFYFLLDNLRKIEEDRLKLRAKQFDDMKKRIRSDYEFSPTADLKDLTKYARKELMRDIKRNSSEFAYLSPENLKNAVRIYMASGSIEERQNLFNDLYDISTYDRNRRTVSTVLKEIKDKPEYKEFPEIKELFTSDNIFVKHSRRALKMVQSLSDTANTDR